MAWDPARRLHTALQRGSEQTAVAARRGAVVARAGTVWAARQIAHSASAAWTAWTARQARHVSRRPAVIDLTDDARPEMTEDLAPVGPPGGGGGEVE
jgi:hypothetical protein